MKARKTATSIVLRCMAFTRGKELADYWAWEMTPMPVGLPSWKQLRVGTCMAIGLDRVGRKYKRDVEQRQKPFKK